MRPWWAVVAVLVLVGGASGTLVRSHAVSASSASDAGPILPREPGIHDITIDVDGEPATGILAVPEHPSGALLVLAHPYGSTAQQHRDIAASFAERGHLVLVMDYRGATAAWKVERGARDVAAGTLLVLQEHPEVTRKVLFGISMGGEVSGVALTLLPPETFDAWVVGAGVMDLELEWAEAPYFQGVIEAETGGTPRDAPAAYQGRSPLALAPQIAQSRLRSVHLVHATGDTVVPYEHAQRMDDALRDLGVPVYLHRMTFTQPAPVCAGDVCLPGTVSIGVYNHEAGWSRYAYDLVGRVLDGDMSSQAQGPASAAHRAATERSAPVRPAWVEGLLAS